VSGHVDQATREALSTISRQEGRQVSQLVAAALRLYTALPAPARRLLFNFEGMARPDERQILSERTGRAILDAYSTLLDQRVAAQARLKTDRPLETEDGIEDEAVRLTR
jgi:hypothetical protein